VTGVCRLHQQWYALGPRKSAVISQTRIGRQASKPDTMISWIADTSTLSTLQGTKLTLRLCIARQKMDQYSIQPQNCYNMDEKGFLIGHLQKVKRVFPKALMQQQRLLGTGQDGSREWITLIATICADGSLLPPALIYKAVSGDLQDSWLQNYDPQEHPCWFASSTNGRTSDDLGLSWLQSLFHEQTVNKAGRDRRLLILDGHGSHCTLSFLEWCRSNRILVAVFPPHSTHRLQPLDVSLFGPLATYYSQSLDAHSRLSQGLASVTKRDFFKNFYLAFDSVFTEANIRSGWIKTGIEPFNPNQVLKIFGEEREGIIPKLLEPIRHDRGTQAAVWTRHRLRELSERLSTKQ
jgi:hypothetical protein